MTLGTLIVAKSNKNLSLFIQKANMKTIQIGMGWFPEQAGGLNRYYYDCYHYLPQVGVEITGLVTACSPKSLNLKSEEHITSFATIDSSIWQRWLQIRKIFPKIVTTDNYQLVVSHFPLYTWPILTQIVNKPLVVHFHGPWYLEGETESNNKLKVALKWCLEKMVYSRANHFIVLSEAFKNILSENYQIKPEKITVIPGGVDQKNFTILDTVEEARNKLGWSQNRYIIFAVRRLAKRMGLENLIKAIASLKSSYPNILLVIAGKGPLYESLQAQIKENNLQDHVQLLGFISDNDLKLAYRGANFSVIPTISLEGFGLIAIESLVLGTPVLGTPIGGIPEILQPLSPDLVFSGTNSEDLTQGIKEVLDGHRYLPTFTECQNYVANNYAWPIIAAKIKTTYQQVVFNYTDTLLKTKK